MGIYILKVIPKEIDYIPTTEQQNKIVDFLAGYGVEAGHIDHEVSHGIQCHANPCGLDVVACPHCQKPITLEWICDILSEIYDENDMEFHLNDLSSLREAPCCQTFISLDNLNFTKTIAYSIYNADFWGKDTWNKIAAEFPEKLDNKLSEYIGFPAEVLMIRM
ncbi:hypothetical protein [Providencia rustigianii]|uniref:hypothetical protein n=1 Tax=Providencia rustigianii TaxID=158850 RepID=UPI0035ED976A